MANEASQAQLLIYGANGYTGRLITELAVQKGLRPTLAGRSAKEIEAMASEYNLDYQLVSLKNPEAVDAMIESTSVVLNCAGPFEDTCQAFIEPCLKHKTHYLDITGEIPVFETFAALDQRAKSARIMMMPGTGFDVVPTDCLAKYLSEQLPNAHHLSLAFMGVGAGLSRGTATTMIRNLGQGGAVRKNGRITKVKNAYKTKSITYRDKPILSATIPWGDVSTAWYSTGIPNIEVYLAVGKSAIRSMKFGNYFGWLLRQKWVQNRMIKKVRRGKAGPSDEQRQQAKSYIWGEVRDEQGNQKTARLECGEGYTLTAQTAVLIAQKVLAGNAPIGFQTPSNAYGPDLILEIDGTKRIDD